MEDWDDDDGDWEMGNWDSTEAWEEDIKLNDNILEYNILSIEEIESKRMFINSKISRQYNMNIDDIDLIIRVIGFDNQNKWNSFFDNQFDFRKQNNILCPSNWKNSNECEDRMKCSLCYGDYEFKNGYLSICGHWHCKDCCRDYLESEINGEGGGIFVGCMALVENNDSYEKCNIRIPYSHVKQLVNTSTFEIYAKNITSHFVRNTSSLTGCPGLNCEKYVEYTEGGNKNITCECDTSFCFGCKLMPHFMVPCDLAGSIIYCKCH
jgi:ariadne-1